MSIVARCPECGTQYRFAHEHVGRQAKCKRGHVFVVTPEVQPARPQPTISPLSEVCAEPATLRLAEQRRPVFSLKWVALFACLGMAAFMGFSAVNKSRSEEKMTRQQQSATAAFWNDLWKHSSEQSKAQDLPQLIAELNRELEKDRAKVRKAESDGVDPLALHLGKQYLGAGDAILEWFHHVNWMQENWIRVEAGKLTGGDAIPKFGRLTSVVTARLGDVNTAAPAVYNDLRRKYPSQSFLSPSAIDPAPFQAAYQAAQQDEQTLKESVKTGFAIGFAVGAHMAGSE